MQLGHFAKVSQKRTRLLEHLYCLSNAYRVLKQEPGETEEQMPIEAEMTEYICGVVEKTQRRQLERLVFRAGRASVC